MLSKFREPVHCTTESFVLVCVCVCVWLRCSATAEVREGGGGGGNGPPGITGKGGRSEKAGSEEMN